MAEQDEPVPQYVWCLLEYWATGKPLNFKGNKVPLAVQHYITEHRRVTMAEQPQKDPGNSDPEHWTEELEQDTLDKVRNRLGISTEEADDGGR